LSLTYNLQHFQQYSKSTLLLHRKILYDFAGHTHLVSPRMFIYQLSLMSSYWVSMQLKTPNKVIFTVFSLLKIWILGCTDKRLQKLVR